MKKKNKGYWRKLLLLFGIVLNLLCIITAARLHDTNQRYETGKAFRAEVKTSLLKFQSEVSAQQLPPPALLSSNTISKESIEDTHVTIGAKRSGGIYVVDDQLKSALENYALDQLISGWPSLIDMLESDEVRELIRGFIQEHPGLMQDIKNLGLPDTNGWEIDLFQGHHERIHGFDLLSIMIDLLQCEAYLEAENGNIEKASNSLHNVLCFMKNASEKSFPNIIMVHENAYGSYTSALALCFHPGSLDRKQTQRLIHQMATIRTKNYLKNSLYFATHTMYMDIDKYRQTELPIFNDDTLIGGFLNLPLMMPIRRELIIRNENAFTDLMKELLILSEQPYYKIHLELEALHPAREKYPPQYSANSVIVPNFKNAIRLYTHSHSTLDTAMLGLAVELFHRENGAYPVFLDTAAEGVGITVPVDPFTGEPYCYHPTPDGYTLYGRGENQLDDNGEGDDIRWR